MPATDVRPRATTLTADNPHDGVRARMAVPGILLLLLAATATTDVAADPIRPTRPSSGLGENSERQAAAGAVLAAATAASDGMASCARRRPAAGVRAVGVHQGSTVALVRAGSTTLAYVAHEDDATVRTFDVDAGVQRAITRVAGAPSALLVLADGRVAVALRDRSRVALLEPGASPEQPLTPLCALEVAAEPVGLATTPDDATLLITSGWGRRLAAFDVSRMTRRLEVALPREPRAVVTDGAGERAFVAHVVGARMSVVDLSAGTVAPPPGGALPAVRSVDLAVRKQTHAAIDERAQRGCQGFALAKSITAADAASLAEKPLATGKTARPSPPAPPSGSARPADAPQPTAAAATPDVPRGRIYAPMVTVDPGNAGVSAGYGGDSGPAERAMVSVVDARGERALTRTVVAERSHRAAECLLPRAATYLPSSGTLLVACMGIDAVLELDARGVDPGRLERRRWAVPSGPTGIALDPSQRRAVVWSQFDGSLSVIDLHADPVPAAAGAAPRRSGRHALATTKSTRLAALPSAAATPGFARGRVLFHQTDDSRISRDGRACASCHPDGRDDALTWSTPEGPRQTIMLSGRTSGTAPFGWSGNGDSLHDHVSSTLERLRGRGMRAPRDAGDLAALLEYVTAMRAPTSPARADEATRHGRELFFDARQGCAGCHVGGGGTDAAKHAVQRGDKALHIDTPSLKFVSGTAPYFHDGRFDTLYELLGSPEHAMGRTLHLHPKDRAALAAYLETL